MRNDLTYPDELSTLDTIGIFHLNVHQGALLIAKCLWVNGDIDVEFDEGAYYDDEREPELIIYLKDEINKYEAIITRAIDDGKLEAPIIKRDLDECLVFNETYIDAEKLANFLYERGVDIYGDEYSDYVKQQSRLLEIARTAVKFGTRQEATEVSHTIQRYILILEAQIRDLKAEKGLPQALKEEDFSTKEKNTLLKLLLGLTLTNYEYNPHSSRNATAREITSDLALHDISIDEDTVRKWLNEAKQQLPIDWKADN